jgi:hypothetical protein
MEKKKFHTVGKFPKSNINIRRKRQIPLTHKYTTVHFPGLVDTLTHKYTTVYFPGLVDTSNTQIHDCLLSLSTNFYVGFWKFSDSVELFVFNFII